MENIKKKFLQSTGYNLLTVYSGFFFGIFIIFFIARLITVEEWGYLIIAQSYIEIAIVICFFFPPAAESSVLYFIPKFEHKGDQYGNRLRELFFHFYKIRLISSVIIYLVFLLILNFLHFKFEIYQIILIISPSIIFNVIFNLNIGFFLALFKYKLIFLVNFINSFINTVLIISIFIFNFNNTLIYISYIILFCSFFTFLISTIFLIHLIFKKFKYNKYNSKSNKINFNKIHKNYGINLVIESLLSRFTTLIIYLLFLNFKLVVFVTYFQICENIARIIMNFSVSNRNIYISIFSEIFLNAKKKMFKKSFYQLSKYILLFAFFIASLLFYFMDPYLLIIYSEKYLLISFSIKIFLFTTISRIFIRNLLIIAQSTNNTIINTIMAILRTTFILILIFIGLLFYNFTILVIFYNISLILLSISLFFLIQKKVRLNLNFLKLFKPILIFIISFIISIFISNYITLKLPYNNILIILLINSTLKLLIFLIIFYIIILTTKFITKQEFNQIIRTFGRINVNNKKIKFIIKIINFLLPSEKK